jgi:hypothetical protein
MEPIGEFRWFAVARVRQNNAGQPNQLVRIPGEWHGRTKEQAEAKARKAAKEWIEQRMLSGHGTEQGTRD